MSKSNTLAKPFTIGGFVVGEIYMLLTALAPNAQGVPVPLGVAVQRVLALAFFFGPFGAAAGLGLWLLLISLRSAYLSVKGVVRPSPKPAEPPAEN